MGGRGRLMGGRVRPKWEAAGGSPTDFTAKRIASPARVRSASHGLTDLRVRDLRGRVRERPCEAVCVRGRVRPCSPDWLRQIT